MMISPQLLQLICSISPEKLFDKHISEIEFEQWKEFMDREVPAIGFFLEKQFNRYGDQKHQENIAKSITDVVYMIDLLQAYLVKRSRVLRGHPQSKQLNFHYRYSLSLLENLLSSLNNRFSNPMAGIKIPQVNLREIISYMRQQMQSLTTTLTKPGYDPDLVGIFLSGMWQLIKKKNITIKDADYIQKLIKILSSEPRLDNEKLFELLLTNDFNTQEFHQYYLKKLKNRFESIEDLHGQRDLLLEESDRLLNLSAAKGLSMPFREKTILSDLQSFLKSKNKFAKKRIKLRKREIKAINKEKMGTRFLVNLPVPQFGLFIRMQIEKGVLAKENIGEIFRFFATHFYTSGAQYISAESLQKKSTDVEFSSAQKLKGQLIGMLNWLNTNYNLSNYN